MKRGKFLTHTLYCYVEETNGRAARVKGASFGSFSNYVNYLIAKDNNDTASMKRSKQMAEQAFNPPKAPSRTKAISAKGKAAKPAKKSWSKTKTRTKAKLLGKSFKATPGKTSARASSTIAKIRSARPTTGANAQATSGA